MNSSSKNTPGDLKQESQMEPVVARLETPTANSEQPVSKVEQSPPTIDQVITTEDSALLGEAPELSSSALAVVRAFHPEEPEERQTAVMNAAALAARPFSRGARIDKGSLVTPDASDETNEYIRTGNFPTTRYESPVGYYGFEVEHDATHTTYRQSKLGSLVLGLEKWFYKIRDGVGLLGRGKRQKITGKGFQQRILDHARNLGIAEPFSINEAGELRESIEDVKSGAILDDLIRLQGREDHPFIQEMAPQAESILAESAKEIARIHATADRGIGEVLCNDIIVKIDTVDGKPQSCGVRLAIPEVQFAETVDPLEQKALDLSDFCFSVGSAAIQSGDLAKARHFLKIVLDNYEDPIVKTALLNILPQSPRYGHFTNRQRLGYDRVNNPKETFEAVRGILFDLLKNPIKSLPESAGSAA